MISTLETHHSLKENPIVLSEISKGDHKKYWLELKKIIEEAIPNTSLTVTESLSDKEEFGDIDIIITSPRPKTEDNLEVENALSTRIITHTRIPNDTTDHFILRMSDGKNIAVDFIRATDTTDLETKKVYYSKYPLSALLGTLASNLGFSYSQDGLFYVYIDRLGKLNNILVTKDLREGICILGLDANKMDSIKSLDDIQRFIQSSKYFSPEQFQLSRLSQKRREHIKDLDPFFVDRISDKKLLRKRQERILYTNLSNAKINRPETPEAVALRCQNDFQNSHPQEHRKLTAEISNIESQIH